MLLKKKKKKHDKDEKRILLGVDGFRNNKQPLSNHLNVQTLKM